MFEAIDQGLHPPRPEQGMMHNRAFFERVLQGVQARIGDLPEDIEKSEAFRLLGLQAGASSLVSLGREIWGSDDHPVVDALIRPGDILGILDRWLLLERFSHTHNRTRIIKAAVAGDGLRVTLEHHALGGRAIDTESHLFVWGVLVGLFERARLPADRVRLCDGGEQIFEGGVVRALREAPHKAHRAELSWVEMCSHRRTLPVVATLPHREAVRRLLASDVTRALTVHEVARHLGVSSRTLQRSLREAGTSYRELQVVTRLARARELLSDTRLSLADVAFSSGFSDQAHMTRAARTHWMLAPSQFRALIT